MDDAFECWVPVPETSGWFAVSNLGHFRRLAKKRRIGGEMVKLFVNENVRLIADNKTGELGWYGYLDGEGRFFRRDDLMRLFPEGFADVDHSADAAAVLRREETYRDLAKGGGRGCGSDPRP